MAGAQIACFFLSQGEFLSAGYSNIMSLLKVVVSLYYVATIAKHSGAKKKTLADGYLNELNHTNRSKPNIFLKQNQSK